MSKESVLTAKKGFVEYSGDPEDAVNAIFTITDDPNLTPQEKLETLAFCAEKLPIYNPENQKLFDNALQEAPELNLSKDLIDHFSTVREEERKLGAITGKLTNQDISSEMLTEVISGIAQAAGVSVSQKQKALNKVFNKLPETDLANIDLQEVRRNIADNLVKTDPSTPIEVQNVVINKFGALDKQLEHLERFKNAPDGSSAALCIAGIVEDNTLSLDEKKIAIDTAYRKITPEQFLKLKQDNFDTKVSILLADRDVPIDLARTINKNIKELDHKFDVPTSSVTITNIRKDWEKNKDNPLEAVRVIGKISTSELSLERKQKAISAIAASFPKYSAEQQRQFNEALSAERGKTISDDLANTLNEQLDYQKHKATYLERLNKAESAKEISEVMNDLVKDKMLSDRDIIRTYKEINNHLVDKRTTINPSELELKDFRDNLQHNMEALDKRLEYTQNVTIKASKDGVCADPISQPPVQKSTRDIKAEQDTTLNAKSSTSKVGNTVIDNPELAVKHRQSDKKKTTETTDIDPITALVRKEILAAQEIKAREAYGMFHGVDAELYDQQKFKQYYNDPKNKHEIEALLDHELVRSDQISHKAEVAAYQKLHEQFKDSYKTVEWETSLDKDIRSKEIKTSNGATLGSMTELTKKEPLVIDTEKGVVEISSYREVKLPMQINGPAHISLALKDANGDNMPENQALYCTAHYDKDGKLTEVTKPQGTKSIGDTLYVERNGEVFTLPFSKTDFEVMEKQVAQNKGQEVNKSLAEDKIQAPTKETIVKQELENSGEDKKEVKPIQQAKVEGQSEKRSKITTVDLKKEDPLVMQILAAKAKLKHVEVNQHKTSGKEAVHENSPASRSGAIAPLSTPRNGGKGVKGNDEPAR